MVATGTTASLEGLALDFEEDVATRWVPDVLGNFDLTECLGTASLQAGNVQFVDVPKASGGWRTAPVLDGQALRALRDAVWALRYVSDSMLDPSVCGYRSGSTGGSAYSDEYMRFRSISSALADNHRYVVTADVRNFFDSVNVETVHAKMSSALGSLWQPIHAFLIEANDVGIRGLPAGYGDARLIANHLLGEADASIGSPFTRWVDDYRIFADTQAEASRAVDRLIDSLEGLGLKLNDAKLEVVPAGEYLTRKHGVPLESVYHPRYEPRDMVRANLRNVFLRAVSEENRRLLRFSLPRLAEQKDAIAVDYAINQIGQNSVDTPRLIYYLSAFLNDTEIGKRIEMLALTPGLSPWAVTRLCPLLYGITLTNETLDALSRAIQATHDPITWSALLRVLGAHGQKDVVIEQITAGRLLDPRAAIGACVDIGKAIPAELRALAPLTARAADQAVVIPWPTAYTLL